MSDIRFDIVGTRVILSDRGWFSIDQLPRVKPSMITYEHHPDSKISKEELLEAVMTWTKIMGVGQGRF